METDVSETVQSVNPTDGSATLRVHMGHLTATMNGKPVPGMAAITDAYKDDSLVTLAPNGKVLSMKMPPSAAGKLPAGMDMSKFGGIAGNALPVGPVMVGDTWDNSADLAPVFGHLPGAAGMEMRMLSSLVGLDTGAQTVATIRQTYGGAINASTPIPDGRTVPMTGHLGGSSLMKFDVTDGSILFQDGTVTANMTMGLPKGSASPHAPAEMMYMKMQESLHLARLDTVAPKS